MSHSDQSDFDTRVASAMAELEGLGRDRTVAETMAAILEVDDTDLLARLMERELKHAVRLADGYYSEHVMGDPRARVVGVAFIQGITFAAAIARSRS